MDEVAREKNRTKATVRAKVEHAIGVITRIFGFVKVRYRGLAKNTHRLLVTCALANLFLVRRRLLSYLLKLSSLPKEPLNKCLRCSLVLIGYGAGRLVWPDRPGDRLAPRPPGARSSARPPA